MQTLFKNVTAVLAAEAAGTVLSNAYIGIDGGKITYVGTTPPEEKHPPSADGTLFCERGQAQTVIDGTNKVLMPGIVNAHTHLPMVLLRGFADDMDLQTWLFQHIFPAEDKMTEETVYTGMQLALMECIASGTVSVTEMYFFPWHTARAIAESGMNANICRVFMGDETDRQMKESLDLIERFHRHDNGRIRVDACVHAEYTSLPSVWETAAQLARDKNLRMQVHVSETAFEHNECVSRHGLTPVAVLDKHGLFSVPAAAAHCVHVTDEDIDILAARGATAVHNPVSNLKLNSGTARVRAMRDKGLNVALGTDGCASNNSHDMFEEMKTAAILASGEAPLTAAGALRMATRNGAVSQGRAGETGVISEGMDADLILLDFGRPHLTPLHNPVSSLVYSARGSDVVLTMVRGKVLYKDGEFLTIDREKVLYEARKAACIF
jgi:5-methylthioadenosine/S-adenosylhomocysteine deaminase